MFGLLAQDLGGSVDLTGGNVTLVVIIAVVSLAALAMGAKGISLGRRILRAETASMAVLAMLSYHFELGN